MKEPCYTSSFTSTKPNGSFSFYDRGTAKDVDAVRAFEAAIDDAMIEIYQNEDQHQ